MSRPPPRSKRSDILFPSPSLSPAIVAERRLGAVRAGKRSIALTRGSGLVLAALIALVTFAAELVAQIYVVAGALMASANAINPIAMAVVDGLAAAVQSGAAVLLVLITEIGRAHV